MFAGTLRMLVLARGMSAVREGRILSGISKRIVEAHRGELSVSRNRNGGATFRFTLPAIQDETQQ